jgi:hypothetical protein
MKDASKIAALLCAASLAYVGDADLSSLAAQTVSGWPDYLAMGAIGGPNVTPPTATSRGGNDDFGGRPVDVVFKYAGLNGNGDPGIIDPPSNALRMTNDLRILSGINKRAMRVAIVEYTAQMSGGLALTDFSNTAEPNPGQPTGSYIMARHFVSLGSDAMALNSKPVVYKTKRYYGTLILNPDLLGAIQQGAHISEVNAALPAGAVNKAIDQALCFLTKTRSYHNTSDPNGVITAPYINKTYKGTPVVILSAMLKDGYPVWSIDSQGDVYWNIATNNLIGGTGSKYSRIGVWFNQCVSNPTYDQTKYRRPNFPRGFEGWVQANNWLIRTLSPAGRVTFGWQDNMWAVDTGFWLHDDLTGAEIASTYSTPLSNWLKKNAPSTVMTDALGAAYRPDYFAFDRYETDDSASPGQATLYNARSWDNFLTAVGQVSKKFSNVPIMLWQIPGSHIPYVGEKKPTLYNGTPDEYVFSTAPVYFFGDSNLTPDLSNIIRGTASSSDTNTAVGNFLLNCDFYHCPAGSKYKQYLLRYKGRANNYDWSKDNRRLNKAANSNVFAILWGGGNTTNVIKNFSNSDDHGWLAAKIRRYYKVPTPVPASAP